MFTRCTDSRLRFDSHARNVTRTCNFHIRALRHVRGSLTDDVAQTVACSIVSSKPDYCNALLCGTPKDTFDKLQRVQNNIARVVCQRGGRANAGPLLRSFHWFPLRQRVTYKVALTTFKVSNSVLGIPRHFNILDCRECTAFQDIFVILKHL